MIAIKFPGIRKHPRFPLALFLCFYLLFSLITFKDYGIAADENTWYTQAGVYLKHYFHRNNPGDESGGVFSDQQASHNYIYPALLRVLCPRKGESYHLANLLLAIPAYWGIYSVLLLAYRKPWWALLGPFFLFLVFRFSGDVPVNPKDGPFAVFYSFGLAWIYLSRHRIKDLRVEAVVLGVLIGLATTIRAVGITLLPILVVYRFYEFGVDERAAGGKVNLRLWIAKEWLNFTLVFIVSQCWIMAFWPYVGSNYFGNILNVFLQSKAYPFDIPMMFMGRVVMSAHLPWYYLVVWFAICVPLFILAFSMVAFFLFRKKAGTLEGKLFWLLAATLGLHFALYVVLRPIIYNTMRHYLFIVPILCAMAALGCIEFFRGAFSKTVKRTAAVLLGLNLALVMVEFVRLYPYQYVYFNETVGGLRGANGKFELEYWNCAFKEATQWLEEHEITDPNRIYRIRVEGTPWQETYYFKPNMVGDPDMKNPDYEFIGPVVNPLPLRPDQKLIRFVGREGVGFIMVIKRERPGKS